MTAEGDLKYDWKISVNVLLLHVIKDELSVQGWF